MKFLSSLIFALAAASTAIAADDPVFAVEPGLYHVQHNVSLGGQPLLNQSLEYCVTPEESTRSLSSLMSELEENAACALDNIDIQASKGHADMFCDIRKLGLKVSGQLSALYEPERVQYIYVGRLVDTFIPAQIIGSGKANLIGACPPPGIQDERP